jgi:predicted GNAT family acetyltransferase
MVLLVQGTERAIPRLRCMSDVIDNKPRRRFELETAAGTAHLDYERDGDVITLTHTIVPPDAQGGTIVPPDAQGGGVGSRLVEGALRQIRADGLRVIPLCSFVAAYLRRHPDAATLD